MKKNQPNRQTPPQRKPLAGMDWQKLFSIISLQFLRALPATTVVLVLSTLILYLTVGMANPNQLDGTLSVAANIALNNRQLDQLEFSSAEYADINFNRSLGQLETTTATTTAAATTAETTAATSLPTPTVSPTATVAPTKSASPTPKPTSYPRIFDANGIPQEGMPVSAFTVVNQTVYIKVNEANIRKSPNTSSAIIAAVTMGDRLTRLGYGLDWSKVKTEDGDTGYVLSKLITTETVNKPTPTPTPAPKPTAAPTPRPTTAGSILTDAQKQDIIDLAKSCLGIHYVYGGESRSGFDCSGFTTYIYKTLFNITLPRSARDQARNAGVSVSKANIQVGDIICFDWDNGDGICDHVGLYIGGGQYIHAAHSKGAVVQSTLKSTNPIVSIRRIIH